MNQLGLRKLSKKFKVTTNSKHYNSSQCFEQRIYGYRTVNLGVGHHLYPSKRRLLYLTTVLDLYDRKIIGWSLSSGMSVEKRRLGEWLLKIEAL
jgi:transposase InsO family protein